MDINAKDWEAEATYKKHDVVKFNIPLDHAGNNKDITRIQGTRGDVASVIRIHKLGDLRISAYVKKSNKDSKLTNHTKLKTVTDSDGIIDIASSNGLGIGLRFKDWTNTTLAPKDPLKTFRAITSSEIVDEETLFIEKYILKEDIPEGTEGGYLQLYTFCSSMVRAGDSVSFTNVKVDYGSPYFYCTNDHTSRIANYPLSDENDAAWTQKFLWRPSYGTSFDFEGLNHSIEKDEGEDYQISSSINSLRRRVNINFNNRDDREAKAIVHFLQEKHFEYESIYSLNEKGERPESLRIKEFDFPISLPYRLDSKFICNSFNHQLKFRNNHNISAVFESPYDSELEKVCSFNGYNPKTDLILFVKLTGGGPPYTLNIAKDTSTTPNFWDANDEAGGGITNPENCQTFEPKNTWPKHLDGVTITPSDIGGGSGEVFLHNYQKVRITSNISKESTNVTIEAVDADTSIQINDEAYFPIVIPCPGNPGVHSIFIDKPEEIMWYPYLAVRNCEFKPSYVQDIEQSPRNTNSGIVDHYQKLDKDGPNQNLFRLQVSFDYRTEKEAKKILLFLEQHLGYKKFRFQLPRPYLKNKRPETTLTQNESSIFYCPSWSHQIVYKDCHRIRANFIESPSAITNEPFDDLIKFGRVGSIEKPCFKTIYNPSVVKYEICPPSSNFTASLGPEFDNINGNQKSTIRQSDLMICIDRSGSMSGAKAGVAQTVGRQLVASWRQDDQSPFQYVTAVNQPVAHTNDFPESFGLSAAEPNLEQQIARGFDPTNLDKFAIKIDQKRVNLGIVYFNSGSSLASGLNGRPQAYNKTGLINSIVAQAGGGTAFDGAMRTCINEFNRSDRAFTVNSRIIIFISDGQPFDGNNGRDRRRDAEDVATFGRRLHTSYSSGGGNPRDDYVAKVAGIFQAEIDAGSTVEQAEASLIRQGYDPNSRTAIGSWADDPLPVVTFTVAVPGANTGLMSNMASRYGPPGAEQPLFFNASNVADLVQMIRIIMDLTEDTGSQNFVSFTVKNCGPKPARIIETKVRFADDTDAPLFTVTRAPGVFDYDANGRTQGLNTGTSSISPEANTGGQYINDVNNPNFPGNMTGNVKWKSGNVPDPGNPGRFLQLFRGGTRLDVNNSGGDPLISTNWNGSQGAANIGVFCKDDGTRPAGGKYIRLFRATNPAVQTEITDLNIGTVDANNPVGNYDHLPELQPGEELDLFFTIKTNNLYDALRQVQFVFVTRDGSCKQTECYANIDINMYTVSNKNVEIDGVDGVDPPPEQAPAPDAPDPVAPGPPAPPDATFTTRMFRNGPAGRVDDVTDFEFEGGNCRGTRHGFWRIQDAPQWLEDAVSVDFAGNYTYNPNLSISFVPDVGMPFTFPGLFGNLDDAVPSFAGNWIRMGRIMDQQANDIYIKERLQNNIGNFTVEISDGTNMLISPQYRTVDCS